MVNANQGQDENFPIPIILNIIDQYTAVFKSAMLTNDFVLVFFFLFQLELANN